MGRFCKSRLRDGAALAIAGLSLLSSPAIAQIDEQFDIRPNNATQGQPRDVADQLLWLGQQEVEAGNIRAGIAAWYRAIDLYTTLGDLPAAGLAYDAIGQVLVNHGDYTGAEDVIRRRLAIANDHNDFIGQVYGFNNLGNVLIQRGHLRQAEEAFQTALQIAEDIEDAAGIGVSLSNLGLVARMRGDLEVARTYYEAATNYRFLAADRVGQAHSSNGLGQIYRQLGEDSSAIGAFRVARRAALETDSLSILLTALDGLIDIYRDRGDLVQARRYLDERIAATNGANASPAARLGTLIQLGKLYEQTGEISAAIATYREALVLAEQVRSIADKTFLLNRLQALQFQPDTAVEAEAR